MLVLIGFPLLLIHFRTNESINCLDWLALRVFFICNMSSLNSMRKYWQISLTDSSHCRAGVEMRLEVRTRFHAWISLSREAAKKVCVSRMYSVADIPAVSHLSSPSTNQSLPWHHSLSVCLRHTLLSPYKGHQLNDNDCTVDCASNPNFGMLHGAFMLTALIYDLLYLPQHPHCMSP